MSTRKNIPTEHITQLRKALGLSMLDMARAVGMTGADANTIDHWQQTERGARPVSGPVAVVLRYMAQAVDAEADAATVDLLGRALPRFLDCTNLEDEDDGTQIVMHTRWPRFYGVAIDELPDDVPDAMRAAGMPCLALPEDIGGGWFAVCWIDQPVSDPTPVVTQAANLLIAQARRDLAE